MNASDNDPELHTAPRRAPSRVPIFLLTLGLLGIGCSGGSRPDTGARAASKAASRGKPPAATLPAAIPAASASSETAPEPPPTPVRPPRAGERSTAGKGSDPTVLEIPPPGASSRARLAEKAARDHTLTVIDNSEAPRDVSLAEAAHKAKEQRGTAPESKIVITNDNLAEYATGQLTLATPAKPPAGDPSTAAESEAGAARDEEQWRRETRELRLKLRRAWEEAGALDEQVAGLRLRFYAEDDPYVRDSEIKPAWDRALDRQRQAELEVKAYRRELQELLEEGRRAGALPGWLREGIEYEPEFEDEPASQREGAPEGFGRHEPVEPERMESPSRPPGR